MMGYDGMMGGYSLFWGFFMLLFWGALIIALVLLIVWLSRSVSGSALDILKRRYARGEISKKEYEDMKKTLR